MSTLNRNTTYENRQDYDLSNCTANSELQTLSCAYWYSVQGPPLISVFPIRVFNDTKFVDPNETDLCYTNDMVKVLCSSD